MPAIVGMACAVGDRAGTNHRYAGINHRYAGINHRYAGTNHRGGLSAFARLIYTGDIATVSETGARLDDVVGTLLGDYLQGRRDLTGPRHLAGQHLRPRLRGVVLRSHDEDGARGRAPETLHAVLGGERWELPVTYAEASALVEALTLAADWLASGLADLVMIGEATRIGVSAILLAAPDETGRSQSAYGSPAYAAVSAYWDDGRDGVGEIPNERRRSSSPGEVNSSIGLLESVSWPLADEIIQAVRRWRPDAAPSARAGDAPDLTCAVGALGAGLPPSPLLSLVKATLCVTRRMWGPTPVQTTGTPVQTTGTPMDSPASPEKTADHVKSAAVGAELDLDEAWRGTPLFSVAAGRPWFVPAGKRRIADVVCAVGGRIGHVLVSEVAPRLPAPALSADLSPTRTHLIPIMGESVTALIEALATVRTEVLSGTDLGLIASRLCRTWTKSVNLIEGQPEAAVYSLALVAEDKATLLKEIAHAEAGLRKVVKASKNRRAAGASGAEQMWRSPRGSAFSLRPLGEAGVTFVYPGVFNSYVGLARDLFQHFPWLHDALGEITEDLGGVLAERYLYPRDGEGGAGHAAQLQAHPTAMIESGATVAIAHTRIMQDVFGVAPRAALGYSMGEVSMLWAMGVWRDADASSHMLRTSPLFRQMISGVKSAVRAHWQLGPDEEVDWATYLLKAPVDRVREVVAETARSEDVAGRPGRVYVTFVNLENEVVIAGAASGCRRVIERLDCHALPVPASVAIHNEAIQAAYEAFVALYTHPVAAEPDTIFYSTAIYAPIRLESAALARTMATMCCQPVDFPRLISRAYADGARIFLELGPLATCTRRIERILRGKPHAAVAVNPRSGDDLDGIVRALACLVAHQVPVDLTYLYDETRSFAAALADAQRVDTAPAPAVDDDPARLYPTPVEITGTPVEITGTPVNITGTPLEPAGARLIDFYGRHLLPQGARAAAMHRALLEERHAAQYRAGSIIDLQIAAGRRLLGGGGAFQMGRHTSPGRYTSPGGRDRLRDVEDLGTPDRGERRPATAQPRFGLEALRAFAAGDPTQCFGPDFAVYRDRRLPRIPNGDLLLMGRVTAIEGQPGVVAPPATLCSEYDVSPEAWFYLSGTHHRAEETRWGDGDPNRPNGYSGLPPYVVLMEMALQPCGFLSAYLRSSLLYPERDLYFRNLDGRGRILAELDLRGKTVQNEVKLLTSTQGQGVIIQTYAFSLSCQGTAFYEGWSSFGYFSARALQRQVGLGAEVGAGSNHRGGSHHGAGLLRQEHAPDVCAKGAGSAIPNSVGVFELDPRLRLFSRCEVVPPEPRGVSAAGDIGGPVPVAGMLLVQGDVTPQDWYFRHHFYQDPVMPGSLGVEAAMQAMVQYARWRYAGTSGTSQRPSIRQVLGHEMVWKYRGQITPEDGQWQEIVDLTETRRDRDGVTLIGEVTLYKAGLPIYRVEGAAVRVDGV